LIMSLASDLTKEAVEENYEGMTDRDRIKWKFHKFCISSFKNDGKRLFSVHVKNMENRLRAELEKNIEERERQEIEKNGG